MPRRRIGILTGGGDVPGLNSVIKGVVYRGTENNCDLIGIRRGWEGLTHVNLDDKASTDHYVWPLATREDTRTIDPIASRAGPFSIRRAQIRRR